MTLDPGLDDARLDAHRLAAAARSILACPGDVRLVVDGVDDVTADLAGAPVEMQDHRGRPVFWCPAGSDLARAARDRRGALLTLASGLGRPGTPDRDADLTLSGRLEACTVDECPCCEEVRTQVVLHLDFALLARTAPGGGGAPEHGAADPRRTPVRVPLRAFASPEHDLNRGFLQRAAEHANACHQDELRRAVSTLSRTRLGEVAGVQLVDLGVDRVVVQWVDSRGAHGTRLEFPRCATTPHDLGDLLRARLHPGLC